MPEKIVLKKERIDDMYDKVIFWCKGEVYQDIVSIYDTKEFVNPIQVYNYVLSERDKALINAQK